MSELIVRRDALMKLIDGLSQDMLDKIYQSEVSMVNAMLSERADLIHELIAVNAQIPHSHLMHYLIDLHERDKKLMLSVQREQKQVHDILVNLKSLQEYAGDA